MRILFTDLDRPKSVAKRLSRLSPDLTLAKTQEALARAMGYRDWHELTVSAQITTAERTEFSIARAKQLVLSLSDALALESGDVQYALSKGCLLGGTLRRMEDQLLLRTTILRERVFGPPARNKPGTIIKVKEHGRIRHAYLRSAGRPTRVVYNEGPGMCADFEAITPRTPIEDFLPARLWLPYGYWTLRDGSEVAFARDYLPLWRISNGVVERLDPWLWIMGITANHYFTIHTETGWWREPARKAALEYLERNRIFELPRLANAMPFMIDDEVCSVPDATIRLYQKSNVSGKLPGYALLNRNLIDGLV